MSTEFLIQIASYEKPASCVQIPLKRENDLMTLQK